VAEPDARFTLANERTYLAWMRTALAIVAGGLAAAHFLDDLPAALRATFATALLTLGGYLAGDSYRRWRANDAALRAGHPLPRSVRPAVLVVGVVATSLAGVVAVLASEL
jgi:putative membrane protein